MRNIIKFRNVSILAFPILLVLLGSCSDSSSKRFRPSDINGVNGLDSGAFETFKNVLAQTDPVTLYPSENTNYERSVTYKNSQIKSYTIDFNGTAHICNYSYNQITENITFKVDTLTDSEGNESKSYSYEMISTPLNPTYTTIPNIGASRAACENNIDALKTSSTQKSINFSERWEKFKTVMNDQIVTLLDHCSRGTRVESKKCIGASLITSDFTENNPVDILALSFEFTWLLDSGVETTTTLEFELAPELYYTETFGFINLEGGLPLSTGSIQVDFNQVSTGELSGF